MSITFPIYMDYNATTPADPQVVEAMLPFFTNNFGNAASRNHAFGWTAEKAVAQARVTIAKLIGAAKDKEIVFTSGATESDNLAIKGVAHFYRKKGNHIITTNIEHKAVLDTCKRLEKEGFEVTYLPVDKNGLVKPSDVEAAITDKTILVSVMLANNEIGTIQPLRAIGEITRKHGVLLHTDAVQGIGKTAFNVQDMHVDLASITAHKIYGPKGVGALYVRRQRPSEEVLTALGIEARSVERRVRITPEVDGGGHEFGMRSGTLNVPSIVGFGKACEILANGWAEEAEVLRSKRDRLLNKLTAELDEVYVNGSIEHRLPNNLNISFTFVEGESMMMAIKDVAVSSGSACTSASLEPSYVLHALGVSDDAAHSSIRFSIGRFTTIEEIDYVAKLVIEKVRKLRDMSPLYEMFKAGIDLNSVEWAAH